MRYRVPQETFDRLIDLIDELQDKHGEEYDVKPSDILTDYLTHTFKSGDIENFTRMADQMRVAGTWPAFKNVALTN